MPKKPSNGGNRLVPWGSREAILGIGLVVGGSTTLSITLLLAANVSDRPLSDSLVPIIIVLPHLLMLFATWYLGIKRHQVPWSALGLRFPTGRLCLVIPWAALIANLGFSSAYVTIITATGPDFLLPTTLPADIMGDGTRRLVTIVLIGLAGPFIEELFFRSFLLTALISRLGTFRAAIVTSILFAASHVDLGVMLPFLVSGMLLSWVYLRTRSIWTSFLTNAAQNLLALWLMTTI